MGTYYFVTGLMILTGLFLIIIVLIQNSKGGGLASNFAGNNQIMGVRRTADWLEKATWTLAIALLAFSLVSVMIIPKGESKVQQSQIKADVEAINFQQNPNAAAAPQQGAQQGAPEGQQAPAPEQK